MKYSQKLLAVLMLLLFTLSGTAMAQNTKTVHIYGIDQMKYTVTASEKGPGITVGKTAQGNMDKKQFILKSITVQPGQKVHIVLTNNSSLPASAMSHNWVLLKNGTDPADFANASSSAKDHNYIAPKYKDDVIAHTDMTGGGDTSEVTFTAPSKTGDYTFLCTFPGHFMAGMKGTLTVKK